MELNIFIEEVLGERIDMLLARYQQGHMKTYEEQMKREEKILGELNEEDRKQVEAMLNELLLMEIDEKRSLYLSGLIDGFKIARMVYEA